MVSANSLGIDSPEQLDFTALGKEMTTGGVAQVQHTYYSNSGDRYRGVDSSFISPFISPLFPSGLKSETWATRHPPIAQRRNLAGIFFVKFVV